MASRGLIKNGCLRSSRSTPRRSTSSSDHLQFRIAARVAHKVALRAAKSWWKVTLLPLRALDRALDWAQRTTGVCAG
eukprot:7178393-Prymnesium_polylepis.1